MFEHLATTDTSECPLYCADGVTELGVEDKDGNFKQAVVHVRSRTCDQVRQHDLDVRRRLVKEAQADQARGKKAAKDYDPEEDYRNGVAKLEVIIAGWENLPNGKGGTIPYNDKTKHELAAMPALDYIHRQIFKHHNADENFMPAQSET